MLRVSSRNFGTPATPQEIRRLRQSNLDLCMRMGQPIVWRHQFTNDDEDDGYTLNLAASKIDVDVVQCPACYNRYRGQVRSDCEICYATGYASVEKVEDEWIDEDGEITDEDLGDDRLAPRWRGYGPPVLTWMMEPDAAVDQFRISDQGAIVQTQNAQGLAPWYPLMADNDLIINVEIERNGTKVQATKERYQLKLVNPQSIRGWGNRTRSTLDQIVGQTFDMARLPRNHVRQRVSLDE